MRILVMNVNTTATMTEAMRAAATGPGDTAEQDGGQGLQLESQALVAR
jgi:hypothetical protein